MTRTSTTPQAPVALTKDEMKTAAGGHKGQWINLESMSSPIFR